MSPKELITHNVLRELENKDQIPYDQAMVTWWHNLSKYGGLRLTDAGLNVFKSKLGLDSWTMSLPRINAKLLLQLDRKLETPYHLDNKKRELLLFGEKEATLATLYGDLNRWLELAPNRNPLTK